VQNPFDTNANSFIPQKRAVFHAIMVNSNGKNKNALYRNTQNDSLCYKFSHKRTNLEDSTYECAGCKLVKRNLPTLDFQVPSIRVNISKELFSSDPEQLAHECLRNGDQYKFEFVKLAAAGALKFV
jgi:hypothetical protein